MSKRLALVWVLFLLAALAASAGDVAQFVNLGFSKDARYFMFGQFGIAEKDSAPGPIRSSSTFRQTPSPRRARSSLPARSRSIPARTAWALC